MDNSIDITKIIRFFFRFSDNQKRFFYFMANRQINQNLKKKWQLIGILIVACFILGTFLFNNQDLSLIEVAFAQYGYGGVSYGDAVSPSISNIAVTVITNEATITWLTDEASVSWVVYGVTTDYGEEVRTTKYVTSHSVTLGNLTPATTYHYRLKSKDQSGNIGSYTDKTFTTSALREKVMADANDDNKVDISDFNLLMINWGATIAGNIADFNADDTVDILDFNLLMIHWTP